MITSLEHLRAFGDVRDGTGQIIGVDRANAVVRGAIVAECGSFKTGRGKFGLESLDRIVRLMREQEPRGVLCRFTHPDQAAGQDPLGKLIGRWKNARVDGSRVRADLWIDKTALKVPPFGGAPLGEYILDLAESDSDALAVSLVLRSDRRQTDRDYSRDGSSAPPLWLPTAIMAADIVSVGDAASTFLDSAPDHGLELLRARWRNSKRRAALFDHDEAELVRARWRNRKRKQGVA